MIRKRFGKWLRRKFGARYVTAGLILMSIIAFGLIVFLAVSALDSGNNEDRSSALNMEKRVSDGPEIRDFTEHKLVRIPEKGWIGGVLAGFAYYFGFPLWLLRLLFVVTLIWWDDANEFLIIGYILLWIFMPSIDFIPADFSAMTE